MRLLTVFISTLIPGLVAGLATTCAQETATLPYEATVKTDQVNVYSGPGKVHYPTNQLPQGTKVEVYRHDPGGWCAIRPVVGSFSMVPVASVEWVEDGLGRVSRDGAKAWVGTRLAEVAEPMWQVKLKRGEEVEILGEIDWETAGGESQPWYQISPPAGEFRWIHRSEIESSHAENQGMVPGSNSVMGNSARQGTLARPGTFASEPSNAMAGSLDFSENQTLASASSSWPPAIPVQMDSRARSNQGSTYSSPGWRRARQPMRVANQAVAAERPLEKQAGPVVPPERFADSRFADSRFADIQSIPTMPSLGSAPGGSGSGASGSNPPMMAQIGDLSQRLADLELALTREMLNRPSNWQLVPLIQQTQLVYQGSEDPNERAQAERLLNKLRNCQRLKFKVEHSLTQPVSSPRPTRSGKPVGSGVDLEVQMGTTYDAYGWLDKLVRDSVNSPSTFVIKDDSGKITHHVSPAPGLTLHRYLRQKVGVIGQRGFHQQLRLDHVTVERVVVLQKSP